MSPKLNVARDDWQQDEALWAAGEQRQPAGGGQQEDEGYSCQWQEKDTNVN